MNPSSTSCQADLQSCIINNFFCSKHLCFLAHLQWGHMVYCISLSRLQFLPTRKTCFFLLIQRSKFSCHKQLPKAWQGTVKHCCKSPSRQTKGKCLISWPCPEEQNTNGSCLLIKISVRFTSVPSTLRRCSWLDLGSLLYYTITSIGFGLLACWGFVCVFSFGWLGCFVVVVVLVWCWGGDVFKSAFKRNNKRIIL